MEDPIQYGKVSRGLCWRGNHLFFHEYLFASISEEGGNPVVYSVNYRMPVTSAITDLKEAESLRELKMHIKAQAQALINKIRNYDT